MDVRSKYLRSLIYQMVKIEGRGHIGPALSLIEILRVLFDSFLQYQPQIQAYLLKASASEKGCDGIDEGNETFHRQTCSHSHNMLL